MNFLVKNTQKADMFAKIAFHFKCIYVNRAQHLLSKNDLFE